MNDDARSELEAFVRSVCGKDTRVESGGPAEKAIAEPTVHCVLIGLSPVLSARNDRRLPMQIHRRYLICSSGGDEAHRIGWLESLMFRSLDSGGFQIESEPPSIELWRSLGLPPQAGFVVRVPVKYQRPVQDARPVETVDLKMSPLGVLGGLVVDKKNIPVRRCTVEIPSSAIGTSTDHEGAFRFAGMPTDAAHSLRVVWKNREFTATAAPGAGFREPFLIKLDFTTQEG